MKLLSLIALSLMISANVMGARDDEQVFDVMLNAVQMEFIEEIDVMNLECKTRFNSEKGLKSSRCSFFDLNQHSIIVETGDSAHDLVKDLISSGVKTESAMGGQVGIFIKKMNCKHNAEKVDGEAVTCEITYN